MPASALVRGLLARGVGPAQVWAMSKDASTQDSGSRPSQQILSATRQFRVLDGLPGRGHDLQQVDLRRQTTVRLTHAGSVVFLNANLSGHLVSTVYVEQGEAIALQCGAWRVCCMWQCPNTALQEGLSIVGDHSPLPGEGPLCQAGEAVPVAAQRNGVYLPIRWNSDRRIDFLQVSSAGSHSYAGQS